MLTIHLVVVGEKMPPWVEQGYRQYEKRIHGRVALNLIEVAAIRRRKNANIDTIVAREDQRIWAAIPHGCKVIALDRCGKCVTTLQFVDRLESWLQYGDQVALLVGGPEGLSADLLMRADETWSLSTLTFAHPVVRVILAEQIYRCYSVLEKLPYHR